MLFRAVAHVGFLQPIVILGFGPLDYVSIHTYPSAVVLDTEAPHWYDQK